MASSFVMEGNVVGMDQSIPAKGRNGESVGGRAANLEGSPSRILLVRRRWMVPFHRREVGGRQRKPQRERGEIAAGIAIRSFRGRRFPTRDAWLADEDKV